MRARPVDIARGVARPAGARRRPDSPRQAAVVATGVASVLLTLAVAAVAFVGLERVERNNRDVERASIARGAFQDADMMHDALYAGVLGVQLVDRPDVTGGPDDQVVEVQQAAARFRDDLRVVDEVPLPAEIRRALERIRPDQEEYIDAAVRLVQPDGDPAARSGDLLEFRRDFIELRDQQDAVTRLLAQEGERARQSASDSRRDAYRGVLGAVTIASLGLLALSVWLTRTVGALARQARHERSVGETLQRMLLPDVLPELPGVEAAAHYVPGDDGALVGGDWYDVFTLPGGEIGLIMGDVAGHDLHAAAQMGQLRHSLRAYAAEGLPPESVMERLNELCFSNDSGLMATCVYAVLNPMTQVLTVVNAGHFPPVLRRPSSGGATLLEGAPRPPVGATRAPRYEAVHHQLSPGTAVLLYTDGLVERRGEPADVGLERLLAAVADGPADLQQLCVHVVDELLHGRHAEDDVAMLAVAPQLRLGSDLRMTFLADPASLVVLRRTLERWMQEAGASEAECFEVLVATSEAATNAIEHAYGPGRAYFELSCVHHDGQVELRVRDWGSWRPPRGRDRGRGLDLIRSLMDHAQVTHGPNGTVVEMRRSLASRSASGATR